MNMLALIDAVCMYCGGECDTHETIESTNEDEWQLWVYCKECKAGTFFELGKLGDSTD